MNSQMTGTANEWITLERFIAMCRHLHRGYTGNVKVYPALDGKYYVMFYCDTTEQGKAAILNSFKMHWNTRARKTCFEIKELGASTQNPNQQVLWMKYPLSSLLVRTINLWYHCLNSILPRRICKSKWC